MTSREDAAALDRADPLAGFRDRLVVGDDDLIYVDGNSLGRLPRDTPGRLAAVVEREWGSGLVRSWEEWIDRPSLVGDLVGRAALGAAEGQVIVCDNTTVNLHKLLSAALAAQPDGRRAVVTDADNFPTDRYVIEGVTHAMGGRVELVMADPVDGPSPADVTRALARGDAGVVCLSHVAYRSGSRADLAAITAAAHDAGALVLWDLSHSAGSVEVGLDDAGVDLAVGCTYKYLNAGPGSPAFLYVSRGLQARLRQPIWGWFAQRDQFVMGPAYDPEPDVRRFHTGTPPIVALAAVEVGAALVEEAGIAALDAKGQALTTLAVELFDERLASLGFTLGSPRPSGQRGAHVSLRHPQAWPICRALIERAGVIPDFRAPDSIRFGFPALYSRFTDVWDAIDRLAALIGEGEFRQFEAEPRRVT